MADLVLDDHTQRALRTLLQVEPAPGVPFPTPPVLRTVLTLVGGDAVRVALVDGRGVVVDRSTVGPGEEARGAADALELGWSLGRGYDVRLRLTRTHRRFTERDVAMLRLVTPVLARLVRGAGGTVLPDALTVQERRVLGLVAEGRSNSEVALALHVSCSTVRKHLEHAYRKLGVHSRLAAVWVLDGALSAPSSGRRRDGSPERGPEIRRKANGDLALRGEDSWDQHARGGTPCSVVPRSSSPSPPS